MDFTNVLFIIISCYNAAKSKYDIYMPSPKESPLSVSMFQPKAKPQSCCHLPMSLTFSVSILGAATAAAGIYLISKTLAAGLVLSNPVFLIGLGLVAAGLALAIGIWQIYIWQSRKSNAIFNSDPEPIDVNTPLAANNSTP